MPAGARGAGSRKETLTAHRKARFFERIARRITELTGSTAAFGLAVGSIMAWGLTGPMFRFSDTWQLVANTGTTVITFLMVFLIQRAQNKEALAVQLKLNELVAAMQGASNRLVNVEDLSEAELVILHRHYAHLAAMAAREGSIRESHSVDEAEVRHARKARKPGEKAGSES